MTPDDYCYRLAAPTSTDFRYSLLGLPLGPRQALSAVQAFCIETAQPVTGCQEASVAAAKLHWWRTEVKRLFEGQPQHPITRALHPKLTAFNLPEEYFREILDGVAMDLNYDAYPDFTSLTVYLHRQGSIPAMLAAEILGYQNRRATPRFAHEAGISLLLFEFLYDIRHHAQQGRLYWPDNEMARYGVQPGDLLAAQTSDRLRGLFAFQAERIKESYRRALAQLPNEDRYQQSPLLIRLELAMALLVEIADDGYRLLEQRIALTPLRKLWLAWRWRQQEKIRHRRLGPMP